ncbi:MAG TPA: hypothetical protein VK807_12930 [Gemmatimonadaceae bacterium]|nr:hypothetical protein [Gemmatimonadaceae bacterium]
MKRIGPPLAWVACGVYLASRLAYGWNPHDEGLLAQTALRVLGGELPHRDFDDAYTGGLAIYHAGVFRLLGTSLISLRVALLAAYLAWLPVVYWIALQLSVWRSAEPSAGQPTSRAARSAASTRGGAAAATFVMAIVAAWSVPNRVAAMPSWYNLFLATAGAAALMKFIETRRVAWLVTAGVAGGLSVLVKLTGLAYIAAALLVLVWDERGKATTSRAYSWFVTVSLVGFVAALSRAVARIPGASPQWHFVVPAAALSALLLWREWRGPPTGSIGRLAGRTAIFGGGIAAPIVVFLVPYVMSASVPALVHGALIAPGQRLAFAMALPQSLRTLWTVIPWVVALVPWRRPSRATVVVVGLVLAALLAVATHGGAAYAAVWTSIRHVAPVLVIAGVIAVARGARSSGEFWVVLCMTALTGLVQFPYAGSDYFSYFAAFPILCAFGLVSGTVPALVGAFFLGFALLCTNPVKFRINGERIPDDQMPSVKLDGLVVGATEARQYQSIIALVRAHSPEGGYVYAAPDLPEISVLTDRKNPTRVIYDFLDDPNGHDARVLSALAEKHVDVIVVGGYPGGFSRPIDQVLMTALEDQYPSSAVIGPYVVRWRPPTINSDVPNGR